jgi:hypothetical protein
MDTAQIGYVFTGLRYRGPADCVQHGSRGEGAPAVASQAKTIKVIGIVSVEHSQLRLSQSR